MLVDHTVSIMTGNSYPRLQATEHPAKKKRQGSPLAFPMKLHTLLQDATEFGFEDVVCWQPGGNSFKIFQPKRFEDEIMKKYFQRSKYKSFQRQLNIYGFRRVHHGPFKGGYRHASFNRENPCLTMTRKHKARDVILNKDFVAADTQDAMYESPLDYLICLDDSELFGANGGDGSADLNDILDDFLKNHGYEEPENLDLDDSPVLDSGYTSSEDQGSVDLTECSDDASMSDRYFPCKLFAMLEDSEKENFADIVSWVADGTAFKVHKRQEFVEKVMPNYFDQTQFESFRRQLNMYGFSRISKGKDRGVAAHPFLRRGERALCQQVKRVSKSPTR